MLNDTPSLRREPVEKVIFDLLKKRVVRSSDLKLLNSNKTPLMPPAESSTLSSDCI